MSASSRSFRFVRRAVLALGTAAALPAIAGATWSIVLIDTSTGEVAIGCATCLEAIDLETLVPVMLTGVGGACAQSLVDGSGMNRRFIWEKLQEGWTPGEILAALQLSDKLHQSRQYGIVDLIGRRGSFTGANCGRWAGGVFGKSGTISYAIQGNVLTGQPVVDDAKDAVLNTPGDLAEKLMAGMEAAQQDGGDGRCSCDINRPDSCGSPPTGYDPDVDKSAHNGFMMVSRIGDVDGDCDGTVGCANGDYYMNLNVRLQRADDPDPVLQLRTKFDDFRAAHRGRPDHIKSTTALSLTSTPGNGTEPVTLTLTLNDWEGTPLGHGGATVTVAHSANSAGLSKIGTPLDLGNGSYTVPITAGASQGQDEFQVVVDDGQGPVTLYPFPTLTLTDTLLADKTSLSAAAGGTVSFDLIGPEETPPPYYLLLCTGSGTTPGLVFPKAVVPLNYDSILEASLLLRNSSTLVNTSAALQPDGTSTASFVARPGELGPIVGYELDFAWFLTSPVRFTSNYVPVIVNP